MALKVVSFCVYLTNINEAWRPRDWDACKFIHAIKGHELNGYAKIPVLGSVKRLNNQNLDSSLDWFALMAGAYCHRKGVLPPFEVVPVLSSGSLRNSTARPRTYKLARAVAERVGGPAAAFDCLRWKKRLGSA